MAHGCAPAADPAPTSPPGARSAVAPTPGTSEPIGTSTGRAVVDVTVPLHLAPVGNRREHPLARARRTRREIDAVLMGLAKHAPPPLPVVFELTRTGWNALDPDGLVAALKAPIDALARWVHVDDRDRRLFWRLSQGVTRATRVGRNGRREAAASLRIVVCPWQPSHGDDPLCVLAVAPLASEAP